MNNQKMISEVKRDIKLEVKGMDRKKKRKNLLVVATKNLADYSELIENN